MNKCLYAFIAVCSLLACAVTVSGCASTAQIVQIDEKSEIIEVQGQNKSQIFDNANKWAVKVFGSAESVLEYSNQEVGTISGKFVYSSSDNFKLSGYSNVKSVITVECKDNKLRLTLQPLEILYVSKNMYGEIVDRKWSAITTENQQYLNLDYELSELKNSLQKYVLNSDSDW